MQNGAKYEKILKINLIKLNEISDEFMDDVGDSFENQFYSSGFSWHLTRRVAREGVGSRVQLKKTTKTRTISRD